MPIGIEILLWSIKHVNSHSKTVMQRFAHHGLRQAYNTKAGEPWPLSGRPMVGAIINQVYEDIINMSVENLILTITVH